MPKFFIKSNQITDDTIQITGTDVNHIKNVLRLKVDDDIQVCNVDTSINYICGITDINNDFVKCTIFKELKLNTEASIHINIFQGLPKSDKMELIIQKSIELGANEITPVEMKRCVAKVDDKNKDKKIKRWNSIAEASAKQCGRSVIPKVNNVINIKNICNIMQEYDIVLLAYENERENTLKSEIQKLKSNKEKLKIGIVIGPEGGLEQEEVEILKQNGAKVVTLGNRILRTETVAFTLTSIIMYELSDLGGNI